MPIMIPKCGIGAKHSPRRLAARRGHEKPRRELSSTLSARIVDV
jgi:hypothetical protein